MPSAKNRRGPHSQKSEKRKKSAGRKSAPQSAVPAETNQPFETDTKRRVGQHTGTGRPPLMKK
jgi:hypothetical protein